MIDATHAAMSHVDPESQNPAPARALAPAQSDPTLASLVPRRSTGRNAMLVGLAILGVICLWASQGVLRPTAVSDSGGATWTALTTHDQVATVVQLDPSGWSRNLQSVTDVSGAQVAGAWIFTTGDAGLDNTLDPADYADGLAYLEAAFPTHDFGEASQLPRSIPRDGPSELVVLWNITDCSMLGAGPAPQAELRTWIGTTTRQSFDDFLRPGFDMATLAETGICPS